MTILTEEKVKELKATLNEKWELTHNGTRLLLKLKFKNFKTPLKLTQEIGQIAEEMKHHPDLKLGWGYLDIEITTHSLGGLQSNDFSLAGKVDSLWKGLPIV